MPSDPDQIAERALMNAIMHDVGAREDVVLHRNNVGEARYGEARVRYGLGGTGAPDLMLEIQCGETEGARGQWRVLWCELKSATGRTTKDQKQWHLAARKRGRPCIVARCVDDVRAAISCVRKGMVTVYDRSKGVEVCDGE